MDSLLRRLSSLAPLLVPLTTGCAAFDPPARPPVVATFDVTATLVTNGCGYGGLPLPGAQQLEGNLRGYAGSNAEWNWSGQSAFSGTSTASGVYVFSSEGIYELAAADPLTGYAGCSVRRRDEITLTVSPAPRAPADGGTDADTGDAGSTDAGTDGGVSGYTVQGQLVSDVYPTAGADCAPMVQANGGTWLALPCQARMTLSGASN